MTIFLRYAASCADLEEDDIREALKSMPMSMKEDIMPTLARKWMEQGIEKGIEKGRQEGRQEGRRETIRETILRLAALGLDIEIICQAVDLPRGEVEKIFRSRHARENH